MNEVKVFRTRGKVYSVVPAQYREPDCSVCAFGGGTYGDVCTLSRHEVDSELAKGLNCNPASHYYVEKESDYEV